MIILIGVAGYGSMTDADKTPLKTNPKDTNPVACTADAKLCPDGSAVGRVGPNCEFAACPVAGKVGTLLGRVTLSPTCPVERNPPDPNCLPKGYATTVTILSPGSQTVVSTVVSDADGMFSVALPVGSYVVKAQGGQTLPRCDYPQSVSILSGETSQIALSCDSGIR